MKRHMHDVHGANSKNTESSNVYEEPSKRIRTNPAPVCSGRTMGGINLTQQRNSTGLLHPFTMSISGPTGCGKTFIVKKILRDNLIKPQPQRIIWMYKRWQPLYDEIRATIHPRPEFVQGIPANLEKDEYINPHMRNLIVLDDLMSASSKDSRITDLFTEGSHHRNLSVISINQNMYYSKDPTQRRNCHYMILFNNPVDQQPVMTLARQMYPGNTKTFMKSFQEAVHKPRGYLLVDLKPTTGAESRLRPNGLTIDEARLHETKSPMERGIAPCKRKWKSYCNSSDSSDGEDDRPTLRDVINNEQKRSRLSCEECGLIFQNLQYLLRHMKDKHWK